jgi:hypothetical protein
VKGWAFLLCPAKLPAVVLPGTMGMLAKSRGPDKDPGPVDPSVFLHAEEYTSLVTQVSLKGKS